NISAHVFGVKQNVHVLVVVHGGEQRRRVACVGISSSRSVCSALASQRSLSLGHAGQGAMVRSSLPCSCSSTHRGSGALECRCGAVSFSRRGGERHTRSASVGGCARVRLALALSLSQRRLAIH